MSGHFKIQNEQTQMIGIQKFSIEKTSEEYIYTQNDTVNIVDIVLCELSTLLTIYR